MGSGEARLMQTPAVSLPAGVAVGQCLHFFTAFCLILTIFKLHAGDLYSPFGQWAILKAFKKTPKTSPAVEVPCVGGSRAGRLGDAGPLARPGLLALRADWGVGAFGFRAQGPSPGVGLPWSLRLAHGTMASTRGVESTLAPSLSGERGCPCGGSPGVRVLGGPRMFGARIFSMPASCLAGWGCCSPHTHY